MQKDWHPEDVKAAVRKRGITFREAALREGIHPTGLTKALFGPYPRAQAILAKYIGCAPQKIWPSRYDAHGNPFDRRKMRSRKASEGSAAANSQNRRAA